MSKPTNKPGWSPSDPSKIIEPSSVKKNEGWSAGEKPSAEHLNWLMKNVSDWVDHVDVDLNNRISAVETGVTGIGQSTAITVSFPNNNSTVLNEYDAGNTSSGGVKTINWANGVSQTLLLSANCSIAFSGATAGKSYFLRIKQGSTVFSITGWSQGIIWNSGSAPAITQNAWAIDLIGIYFDGTNYFAYIKQGHYLPPNNPTGPSNGYCAGGLNTAYSYGIYISTINKMNFSNDTFWRNIQSEWGKGTNVGASTSAAYGNGTQTLTHGYQLRNGSYTLKLSFANDVGATTFIGISASNMNGIQGAAQDSVRAIGFGNQGTTTTRGTWKYLFSTDVSSNLATYTSGSSATANGSAASFSDHGIHIQGSAATAQSFPVYSSSNATDVFTALSSLSGANELRAEGLYDSNYAYFLNNGSIRRWDRAAASVSSLSMGTPVQYRGSAGTQSSANGYFLGGSTSSLSGNVDGSNVIRKLNFTTGQNQVMEATLPEVKTLGAGFEG